MIGHSQNIS